MSESSDRVAAAGADDGKAHLAVGRTDAAEARVSPFPRHLVLRLAAQLGTAAAERAWRERMDRQRGEMLFHPVAVFLLVATALFLWALAAGMMR